MSSLIVFGVSENLTNWLTPVWVFGVGAALGVVLLAAIWGVAFGLSRVAAISHLGDDLRLRWLVGGLLAVVMFVLALVLMVIPGWQEAARAIGAEEESGDFVGKLLSVVALALLCLGLGLGTVTLVRRRVADEIPLAVREGVLLPVFILFCLLGAFGVVATVFIPQKPFDVIRSVTRIPATGTTHYKIDVEAPVISEDGGVPEGQELDVGFHGIELRQLHFLADEQLQLSARPFTQATTGSTIMISASDKRQSWFKRPMAGGPMPDEPVPNLYVRNMGTGPATLSLTVVTSPEYPESLAIPVTALGIVGIFLAYILMRSWMPKLSAIALSTSKSEINQPVFVVLVTLWAVMLIVHVYIPYNTFGEDIKMLKDTGLTLVMLVGIFLAVWAASKSVADEIEGRTALTVLSKPIGRRQFILGKFIGIAWMLALLFTLLGVVFLVAVAYKPIYDTREAATLDVTWQHCYAEAVLIVPGLLLAYMETLVFAALSIAISTRLPMLANFLACFAIYVLGHLTPLMVQSSVAVEAFEPVVFIGQLIATVFPVLDHFNIQAAVAAGRIVPLAYLGWSLLYCFVYSTIAMLLALVLFEDRDLT